MYETANVPLTYSGNLTLRAVVVAQLIEQLYSNIIDPQFASSHQQILFTIIWIWKDEN